MTTEPTPYQVLGVDETADAATIRKAYRRLARDLHPDLHRDRKKEERFKSVGAAYKVLSDPLTRQALDRALLQARQQAELAKAAAAAAERMMEQFRQQTPSRPRRAAVKRPPSPSALIPRPAAPRKPTVDPRKMPFTYAAQVLAAQRPAHEAPIWELGGTLFDLLRVL